MMKKWLARKKFTPQPKKLKTCTSKSEQSKKKPKVLGQRRFGSKKKLKI